jgi:ribonuclease PH
LATRIAINDLLSRGKLQDDPVTDHLAAISVGIYKDTCVLDLDYPEDRDASVDANIVMTGKGEFVEVQSTGEEATYTKSQLDEMLVLAEKGINELIDEQQALLKTL